MNNNMKKKILSATASLIHATTIKNINSTCVVIWGQPKEPSPLKRFKKLIRNIYKEDSISYNVINLRRWIYKI